MHAKNNGSFGYGGTRGSQVLQILADLQVRNNYYVFFVLMISF